LASEERKEYVKKAPAPNVVFVEEPNVLISTDGVIPN